MAQYSMKEAIDKMLQESNWKQRYQATRLQQDWELLVGKTAAKHTQQVQIRENTLLVFTNVAALKHELTFSKELLMQKINEHLGERFIHDIVIA
jgi:predicted nucleic acid-binding Zn ribbon protein